MPDQEQQHDDSGWRVLFAPFGNTLLVGLLLYKLISLIVDMIDKRIHPENYESEKKKLKQDGKTIGVIGKMPENQDAEVKKNNDIR
jgi:hypothetical protein